jgi:hypothetical protein
MITPADANHSQALPRRAFPGLTRSLLPLALGCLLAGPAAAQVTNAPTRPDFNSFRLISERNIFNPNRSSRSSRSGRTETRRAPKVEVISLVGILGYDKGLFAFFDGSSAEYRKALQTSGKIAGYQITAITPKSVVLATDEGPLELNLGGQLRKEDDGPWKPTNEVKPVAASSTATPENAEIAGAASEETDDIVKRLMQKREQELSQ